MRRNLSTRPVVWAALLSFGWIACDQDPTAGGIGPRLSVQSAGSAFYYYQGNQVGLTPDSTQIVVATVAPPATQVLQDALVAVGIQVGSVHDLSYVAANHAVAFLAPSTRLSAVLDAVARLRSDARFKFAAPLYRGVADGSPILMLDRVAVRFRDGVSASAIQVLIDSLGAQVIRPPRPDSGFTDYWIQYPSGAGVDPLVVAATFDRHPLVSWADPDKIADRHLQDAPNDPYYSIYQYHLRNSNVHGGVAVDDNVEAAWNYSLGSGVRVAVLDGGVQIANPDFSFPDGVIGFDAFGEGAEFTPDSHDYHGTSVTGIIMAAQNNGLEGTGVAPAAALTVVKIFHYYAPFQDDTIASDAQLGDAISFAWHYADVLSNSWGGGAPSNAVTDAINTGATQGRGGLGTVIVFSAGNTSIRDRGIIRGLLYPATLSNVIAVGAIDRFGNLTDYTPEGPELAIVAPSGHYTGRCIGDIITTDLTGADGCSDGPGGDLNYTSTFSGTSAAAPQVAATAALLLSREPNLTRAEVVSRLMNAANPWGPATQFGAGKLNAYGTLLPNQTPLAAAISGPTLITAKGTYTWQTAPTGGAGDYTYSWSVYFVNNGTVLNLGTAPTQAMTVHSDDGDFEMRLTVTSGVEHQSPVLSVRNCIVSQPNCLQ